MPGLSNVLPLWFEDQAFNEFVGALATGQSGQVFGVSGSAPGFLTAGIISRMERPALVVTVGVREARALVAELGGYLPNVPLLLLPPRADVAADVETVSRDWELLRVGAFFTAQVDASTVLVAPAEAVRQLVKPWPGRPLVDLARGTRISPRALAERLQELGYVREADVTALGQFAWRGGILDVYPPGGFPVRIEWFDDEVDSLREFHLESQRTERMLPQVTIGPARELLWTPRERQTAMSRLAQESETLVRNLRATGRAEVASRTEERFGRYLHEIAENRSFPGIERFSATFGPVVPVSRMFTRPPVIIYQDIARIEAVWQARFQENEMLQGGRLERGEWLPCEAESVLPVESRHALSIRGSVEVTLSLLPHGRPGPNSYNVNGRPAPRVHGQIDLLQAELQHLLKARLRVVMAVHDLQAAHILQQQIVEGGLPVRPGLPAAGEIGLLEGQVSQGFIVPGLRLAVLGESDLTGREVRPRARARRPDRASVRLADLKVGDFMVHVTHGVGRYVGIQTLEIGGQHKDYLHLEYSGNDTLYVPVDQLNLVQKYVGVEGQTPKLSRMGGSDWARAKEKVRHSVREMAEELVRLYALRESQPGHAFGADTPWQRDFEAAFPYEETPDQLTAVDDIKRDMERARPMDRLLCGDVGYGKTEVALRAAFKAIMDGRQVAFLVPTTVLAEQHFATAKARFAGYPVKVEALSRFRTPKQQKQILSELADGQVDLVIGTHRLLAKDVRFVDLGLLVIDEEHRFGVAHKERIKALKGNVDVLTLSATPIPRTLHMAMVGIRDMSVIETPPADRLPVETAVAEFYPDLIREAIRRELDRGGQVFYVQNRIQAMDHSVARLLTLLPDLRIAVVHGQMDEPRIEETMARFIEQEYDVLMATNIIESGLDIPNANTLIVEDADRLGLAQLYQLRGRVGRSARLAYAYFTYRPDKMLTLQSERRLDAIREFTELGSGYQIALRDLEIRGAGNLLGAEQHGFIASVGFDLYTQLLAEAVREVRGEIIEAPVDPQVEIPADAYIPDTYVATASQKIGLYKRLVAASDLSQVEAWADEVEDRFGPFPESVEKLVHLARIRVLAKVLRIVQVSLKGDRLWLKGAPDTLVGPQALTNLALRFPGRLLGGASRSPELGIRLAPKASIQEVLATAEEVLSTLKGVPDGIQQQSI